MWTHKASYPGNERHQVLLRAAVEHYRDDPRVLAVAVFGSLGRGNWDAYSDLDLDVVIADEARLDAPSELLRLGGAFAAIEERIAVMVPNGDDAGDAGGRPGGAVRRRGFAQSAAAGHYSAHPGRARIAVPPDNAGLAGRLA